MSVPLEPQTQDEGAQAGQGQRNGLSLKTEELSEAQFRDYLRELGEGRQSSIQELDKYTLTLASGTLTLTVGIAQLARGQLVELSALRTAWWFVLASIASTVLSLIFSACTYWYLAYAVRRKYQAGRDWRACRAPWLRYPTRVTTLMGPALFFFGLLFLASFATANLETRKDDHEPAKGTAESHTRTAPRPSPTTP